MANGKNSNSMFEEFVKWMAALPEEERGLKMEILINLFAPSPSHLDFKRLKGAISRKEKRINELENQLKEQSKPTFEQLCKSICQAPDYSDLRARIVAADLYRQILYRNRLLLRRNHELQADIERLIEKYAHKNNDNDNL